MATATMSAPSDAWEQTFPNLLSQMNQTIQETTQQKEISQGVRKQLTDTTKQFKRSVKTVDSLVNNGNFVNESDTIALSTLSKECRGIVKSYQEEIDNLTRRCRAAETAYTTVFKSLQTLPDPVVLLQQASTLADAQTQQLEGLTKELEASRKEIKQLKKQVNTANSNKNTNNDDKDELIQLRKEVAEYEVEFRSLKNQDITIRRLEDKIVELQSAGQESLQQSIEAARQELAMTEGRRASEALEREAAMEAQLRTLEVKLRAERAGREATQNSVLEAESGLSLSEAAWKAQRQILEDENVRIQETLQTTIRQRDDLQLKLSAIGGSSSPNSGPAAVSMDDLILERKAFEAEVNELSNTTSLLRNDLKAKEEAHNLESRRLMQSIETLEKEKSNLNRTLASLEAQLSSAPSVSMVESMKRELRILKRLEYNADDVDADKDPEVARGGSEQDLESVLVAKLQKSEKDLIAERNKHSELLGQYEALQTQLTKLETAKQESEQLVANLEQDLERAIASSVKDAAELSAPSKKTVLPKEDPATLQRVLDPNAPEPEPKPPVSRSNSGLTQDEHSVTTILKAQLDRSRARCDALEAERDSIKRELQAQDMAAENLKIDNAKLYEKVRYLQNYNQSGARVRSTDRDLDLEALEQRYEASVDPFKQFSRAERQRKLNEMSPMERTVFMVAKTVLSTKEMRTGLFFYVLFLHLLVFVTTYHWSHADSSCHGAILGRGEMLAHLPPNSAEQIKDAGVGG